MTNVGQREKGGQIVEIYSGRGKRDSWGDGSGAENWGNKDD